MTEKVIKRVIISGGGTGGHIFPALSIADTLCKRFAGVEILFIGAQGRMEMSKVPEAGYKIIGLEIEGLDRKRLWRNFGVVARYLKALVRARDIVREFAPDVVVGVGGYASAPTLKAAQSLGVPTLIQEQNSYAGVSNKMLARRATSICVAYPDMERFFPANRLILTGNPIRPQIEYLQVDRADALAHFGLPVEHTAPIVLVLGGSLGARTINHSIAQALDQWAEAGVTLIWQTGQAYASEAQQLLEGYKGTVHCAPFIQRMDFAYALSDVVVSRAGASSISELCHLGKPTILVPSPNVAEDHQTKNAMALSSRGAAILVPDAEALERLSSTAISLVRDEGKCRSLSIEIIKLAQGQAAERIVDQLALIAR